MDHAVVVDQDEAGLRVADRLKMDLMLDVAALRILAAQEFAPGREIIEKRTHLDLRPGSVAAVANVLHFPAIDGKIGAGQSPVFAGGEPEPGDAGDTGKRLASETERRDRGEIEPRPDLAGGVALEGRATHRRDPCPVPSSATRIIELPPAADQHLDLARFGVQGILDQFLDHGRRALDHLAGGNLAGHLLRQQRDAAHPFLPSSRSVGMRPGGVARGVIRRRLTSIIPSDSVKTLMITVTDSAVKQLQSLLADEPEAAGKGLRIFVENGGCAGLQYGMALDERKDGDSIVEREGVQVLVDPESGKYLAGSTIDYTDGLTGAGFRIQNPNAVRSCGCGTSFEAPAAEGANAGDAHTHAHH